MLPRVLPAPPSHAVPQPASFTVAPTSRQDMGAPPLMNHALPPGPAPRPSYVQPKATTMGSPVRGGQAATQGRLGTLSISVHPTLGSGAWLT